MKTTFLAFLIIFLNLSIFSQVNQEWVKRYDNNTGLDFGSLIAVDNLGNILVAGGTTDALTGLDILLLKYAPNGNLLWQNKFNSYDNYEDNLTDMYIDPQGNIIVCGYTDRINGFGFDALIIKYNAMGDTLWTRRFLRTNDRSDRAYKIKLDPTGNIYAGLHDQDHSGHYYFGLVKYNPSGTLLWSNFYEEIGNRKEWIEDMDCDNDGYVYMTGACENDTSAMDFMTVKINSAGTLVWASEFNGVNNAMDFPACLKTDLNKNVIVSGTTDEDFLTIKYNSQGLELWRKTYNGPYSGGDQVKSMDIDRAGNIYVTGSSIGSISSVNDFTTIKYNPNGVQQWINRFNAGEYDIPSKILIDTFGNVYVTGALNGNAPSYSNYGTIKLDNSGNLLWSIQYNGPQNGLDESFDIAVDANNNVYITGFSTGINNADDIATVKYSQPIGILPISGELPQNFSLSQNYPNPFNPETKIKFDIPQGSSVAQTFLAVYDILGKQVAILVNQNLQPGAYEVNWNAADFPSGVYFYTLKTGDYIQTRKMVLIK